MPDASLREQPIELAIAGAAELLLSQIPTLAPEERGDYLQRLATLYELGREICGKTALAEVTQSVVTALVQSLPLERCFVALLENESLRPVAWHNIELGTDSESWPISHTMLRRVMDEHLSVLTSDARREGDFANTPSVLQHDLRSVVATPLLAGDECLGLIYVDNRNPNVRFRELDLLFVTALAHYVSIAIRYAQQLERETHRLAVVKARFHDLQQHLLRQYRVVGSAPVFLEAFEKARRLAVTDAWVLISGETGTGKECLANMIHRESRRASGPFVAVNLAALTESLIDSELFGHEKGAFTGADDRRIGVLELADGGTLFLDEVADIPLVYQSKLLRAIETGVFRRVRGEKDVRVNLRVICATCKDLRQLRNSGQFRPDLFYRLVNDEIRMPPLRQRLEDIGQLVQFMIAECCSTRQFTAEALDCLKSHSWPGNVRELFGMVRSLCATSPHEEITAAEVRERLFADQEVVASAERFASLDSHVKRLEREHIERALSLAGGNKTEATRLLKIAKQTLYNKIAEYEIKYP